MTFYQGLAIVLLRVWAAGSLIFGMVSFIAYSIVLIDPSNREQSNVVWQVVNATIYALNLGVGAALWFAAPTMGKRIGGSVSAPSPQFGIDAELLIVVGSFLIGVYFLVEYGPRVVINAVAALYENSKRAEGEQPFARVFWGREMVGQWGVVLVAGELVLGARGMGRVFTWLRQAGLSNAEAPPPRD